MDTKKFGEIVVSFHHDCSQKCKIPQSIISDFNLQLGSFVIIRNQKFKTVCKVYSQVAPVAYIQADDTVTLSENFNMFTHCTLNFPSDFTFCSPIQFIKVKIRVVLKDIQSCIKWSNRSRLKRWTNNILRQYGVVQGFTLNCVSHPIGDVCGVQKIEIIDTYEGSHVVGFVTESTNVQISDVVSDMQLKQMYRMQNMKVGGMGDIMDLLRHYIEVSLNSRDRYYSRLLLIGPSGVGKTILLKKLALDLKMFFYVIQVAELAHVNSIRCQKLFNLISNMSKLGTQYQFIIMLKGLDNIFGKEESKVAYLVLSFLDFMSGFKNFIVFGTAVSSKYVYPDLKKPGRFAKEVHIGVPNATQRESILKVLMNSHNCEADLTEIARNSPGYLGSDLSQLCSEAIRNARDKSENDCKVDPVVTSGDFEVALSMIKPSLLRDSKFRINVQPVYWENVGGMETIKRKLKLYVEWPLLHPDAFAKVGIPCPHGVLLFGPPGCCKTTLVRVIATECKATFLSASPAQIYSPFVGDSEKSIIELFNQARLCSPSIIFLDEIESLVGRRSYSSSHRGIQEKVLSSLLNEMDGIGVLSKHSESRKVLENEELQSADSAMYEGRSNESVIVVAATNRIDLIDDALLRPGRFDSILYVPPPNVKEREAILRTLTTKMAPKDVDMKLIAERTELFSGADLKNLCRMAALSAIKNSSQVTMDHFMSALKLASPSLTKKQVQEYEDLASRYGPIIST